MLKKTLRLIKATKNFKKRRASPLVEEGILIGLGIFCFLLLLGVITGVLDWFMEMSDNLVRSITDLV